MSDFSRKFPVPPSFSDALDYHGADAAAQLRVMLPGTITKFNPTRRTVEVRVGYQRRYPDGSVKAITCPLVDVPLFTLQGGGLHFGAPVEAGDECLVVFADINIDAWFANGGQQVPNNLRRHDLSDAFAFVGPNSLANPLVTSLTASEGGIATATSKVAIDSDTELVTIANQTQNLLTILKTFLTAQQTAMAALGTDPGLQTATKTAATAAAAAATSAITALEALLY